MPERTWGGGGGGVGGNFHQDLGSTLLLAVTCRDPSLSKGTVPNKFVQRRPILSGVRGSSKALTVS